MFTIDNIWIFNWIIGVQFVNPFNKTIMYAKHLPAELPGNWVVAEID
ncbi:hypothetical protein SAMN03080598_02686 [Algoriphagus boritolerans DSM 17298 = JCM 18970]|uniref:Uncharacterized protein n=1 Tax=Algoriphagus boritolerans DSM 17298 = JCM 18970 TaxID=1120964 RepID=A0A1H5XVV8_9BACT|nr:hypothetical protein SAMN03080598_02686 [Algoriphagus boritolerans DSM 17298 = JCM 18970]